MLKRIHRRIVNEAYITSYLSLVINPFYIIRNGLYTKIKSIAPEIKGNILDFGCGSKPYESLFTSSTSYIGIDIENAGSDHKHSKVDIFYDGKTLPFPDEYFDAVVSFEVFEHVFNIDDILMEIRRVLKPNGILLVTVPFAWDEHMVPHDYARYTSYGITHLLERNKFEVKKLEKTSTTVLAISQMFIAYISQYVLPRRNPFKQIFQIIIIFPLNFFALVLNFLMPKRYEYFCNSITISKKS